MSCKTVFLLSDEILYYENNRAQSHQLPKLFQAVPTQLNSLWLRAPWFQCLRKDVPRRYSPHRYAVPQFLLAQYDHQYQTEILIKRMNARCTCLR